MRGRKPLQTTKQNVLKSLENNRREILKNLFHIIKFSSQFQIFILFSVDRITHLIVKLSSPVLPTPPSHQPSSQSPLLLPPRLLDLSMAEC